jgi:general stress protein YciG
MATKEFSRDFFVKTGRRGGQARASNMTPEQRREAAQKAIRARWAKQKKAAK